MYRTPSFGSTSSSQRDKNTASHSSNKSFGDLNNNANSHSAKSSKFEDSKRQTPNHKLDRAGSLSSMRNRREEERNTGSLSSLRVTQDTSDATAIERSSPAYTSKTYIPLTQRGVLLRTNSKESSPLHGSTALTRTYSSSSSGDYNPQQGSVMTSGPLKAFTSSIHVDAVSTSNSTLNNTTGGTTNKRVSDRISHHRRLSGSSSQGDDVSSNESISNRRDMRDAFLRGENAVQSKFDPSHRERTREKDSYEREKDKEKEKVITNGGRAPPPAMTGHNKTKETDGYVGFANLPNQVYRKSVKRGFEFTLMVVGESGLGKSTLINSMFLSDLYSAEYPGPSQRIKKTVQVETTQVILREGGVQLRLTVVDTPGFGDAVDNSNCWQPIIEHIENQYEAYLNSESRVNRKVMPDQRVHCCLYFISPNGHGLKPLDVEFMRRLHDKVNIIPLVAKADTMTPDECREFKRTILNEVAQHKIKIYEFPDCDEEEEARTQKKLKDRVPFAVVGSNTVVDSGGKKVRGRVYPWGVVEVENLEHNDFIALRNMLIRTHMQDLKDVTNNVHYENFRYNKLSNVTKCDPKNKNAAGSPIIQMEEEKKEHVAKMKKMEAEMEQVFEMKVKEKMQKLKDSEADLQRRAEQMKKSLEQQEKEVEEKWKQFEKEKSVWDDQEEERKRSLERICRNSFGFMSGNPDMGVQPLTSSTQSDVAFLKQRTLKKEKKKGLF